MLRLTLNAVQFADLPAPVGHMHMYWPRLRRPYPRVLTAFSSAAFCRHNWMLVSTNPTCTPPCPGRLRVGCCSRSSGSAELRPASAPVRLNPMAPCLFALCVCFAQWNADDNHVHVHVTDRPNEQLACSEWSRCRRRPPPPPPPPPPGSREVAAQRSQGIGGDTDHAALSSSGARGG